MFGGTSFKLPSDCLDSYSTGSKGPQPLRGPRASESKVFLGSTFCCQSGLKVFGINTSLGTLCPRHLWSPGSVHLNELSLGRASGKGEEPRTLGDFRTSRLGPHRLGLLRGLLRFLYGSCFLRLHLSVPPLED